MSYGTRSGGSGFSLRASLKQWVKGWLSGGPHFIIGDRYLLRWYVIPRNPWLNVYLHQFLHDDEDRATHDHPWSFLSLMLRGGYLEVVGKAGEQVAHRRALSLAYRNAEHAHRVVLHRDDNGGIVSAWTVVATGPVVRDWGFWCESGWRHWKEFTAYDDGKGDYGQVGKGCD